MRIIVKRETLLQRSLRRWHAGEIDKWEFYPLTRWYTPTQIIAEDLAMGGLVFDHEHIYGDPFGDPLQVVQDRRRYMQVRKIRRGHTSLGGA